MVVGRQRHHRLSLDYLIGDDTMKCPNSGEPCLDDVCRGSGCLELDGYPMLERCPNCGGDIDKEIPDCSTCTCDFDDNDEFEDESYDAT